jgi:hypothetical protein
MVILSKSIQSMTKQLELFHFDDLCADLAAEIQRAGARHFALEFQSRYPDLYHELKIQMNRDMKQVPALCKNADPV